ncbi:MAG TPA: YbhB/YbcL family Raf kinase inhibitor-like protein [Stenomitos sp.]
MTALRPGVLLLTLLLAACSGGGDRRPSPAASVPRLALQSPAFSAGGAIPAAYTCDGPNVSPPLRWSGVPEGAKSLALLVEDPDAPGKTWSHWVLYNLPPTQTGLAEDVPTQEALPNDAQQGHNDFGKVGYGGPCPPSGTHHYVFKLYALDAPLSIGGVATRADVLSAMQGHVLAEGELTGTYGH